MKICSTFDNKIPDVRQAAEVHLAFPRTLPTFSLIGESPFYCHQTILILSRLTSLEIAKVILAKSRNSLISTGENSNSNLNKESRKIRKANVRFRFLDPDYLRSNAISGVYFRKNRCFSKKMGKKNFSGKFEKPISDSHTL